MEVVKIMKEIFLVRLFSAHPLRFAIVGALGVAVQLAVLHVLGTLLGVPYLIATAIAVASAVAHNFVWHRRWTWRDRPEGGIVSTFARFALANGLVSIVGNMLAMALLVGVIQLPVVAANVIAIAACGVANFALADTVVFRPSVFDPHRHLTSSPVCPREIGNGGDRPVGFSTVRAGDRNSRRERRHAAKQVGLER